MSREKQIEEIARDLCNEIGVAVIIVSTRDDGTVNLAKSGKYLKNLVDKGYRKASEIARAIITEFANMLKCHSFYMTDNYGEVNENVITVKAINEVEAELKKKYIEKGE